MRFKFLAVVALTGALAVAWAQADELLFTYQGELTEDSPLAYDPYGNYYYDLIQFVVTGQGPSDLFWFEIDSTDFTDGGYWQLWPFGTFNPDDAYDPPPQGSGTAGYVTLGPGVAYDLVLSTYNYNPTPLGSFSFSVSGPAGATFSVIPEPGTAALLGLGLLGLLGRQRRGAQCAG